MIVNEHVVGASGMIGINVLATSIGVNQLSHQSAIAFRVTFTKQENADILVATASHGKFVVGIVIVRIFIGVGESFVA